MKLVVESKFQHLTYLEQWSFRNHNAFNAKWCVCVCVCQGVIQKFF